MEAVVDYIMSDCGAVPLQNEGRKEKKDRLAVSGSVLTKKKKQS